MHCRYKGRGLFLSAPTIAMSNGEWLVYPPDSEEPPSEAYRQLFWSEKLPSVQAAFEPGRCKGTLAALYETMIVQQLGRQDSGFPYCNLTLHENDAVHAQSADGQGSFLLLYRQHRRCFHHLLI